MVITNTRTIPANIPIARTNSWCSRFIPIFQTKKPAQLDDLLLRGQFLFVQTGTPGEGLLEDLFCTKNLAVISFCDDICPSPAAWNVLDRERTHPKREYGLGGRR